MLELQPNGSKIKEVGRAFRRIALPVAVALLATAGCASPETIVVSFPPCAEDPQPQTRQLTLPMSESFRIANAELKSLGYGRFDIKTANPNLPETAFRRTQDNKVTLTDPTTKRYISIAASPKFVGPTEWDIILKMATVKWDYQTLFDINATCKKNN